MLVTVKWQSSESLLTLRLGPVCREELAAVAWSSSTHINYKLMSVHIYHDRAYPIALRVFIVHIE